MTEETILAAIGFTEPSTFSEFCEALGDDCPQSGNRAEWTDVFGKLRVLESERYVIIVRDRQNIQQLQLTEKGANRIRDYNHARQPLWHTMES